MSQDKSQFDDVSADGTMAIDANLPPDPSRRFWVATACAVGGAAGVATAVPFVGSFAPSARARAAGAPVEVDLSSIPEGQMATVEWRGKPVWVLHRTQQQIDELPSNDGTLADPNSDRPGFTPDYAKNEYRSRAPTFFVAVGICTHLGCSPTPPLTAGHDGNLADPNSDRPGFTPEYAKNEYRSRDPKFFVAVGICTHLGCSPTPHLTDGNDGGFTCPCHGSVFDLAGRVYKNVPAPDNL